MSYKSVSQQQTVILTPLEDSEIQSSPRSSQLSTALVLFISPSQPPAEALFPLKRIFNSDLLTGD